MWLHLTSAEQVAKEIRSTWPLARAACVRPYDRWHSEDSKVWWVVPSNELPTFKFTKVIVSTSDNYGEPGPLFVGLHCEKGLGPQAAKLGYYPDHLLIDKGWSWHRLNNDLARGALQDALLEASLRTTGPIAIRIGAHVPVIPRSQPGPPYDRLVFHTVDGLRLTPGREPILATDQRFLAPSASATSLPQLAETLATIPDQDYAWIDLYIGRSLASTPEPGIVEHSPARLANELLEPLGRWFE